MMKITKLFLAASAALVLALPGTGLSQPAPPTWQPVSPYAPAATGKPWLGVSLDKLTRYYRRYYRVPFQYGGVLVRSVYPGSPAAAAGLRPGDVVVRIDGRYMYRPTDVVRHVRATRVGQTIRVDLYRFGAWQLVNVTLGQAKPAAPSAPANPWATPPPVRTPSAPGVTPAPVTGGRWVRELLRQITELKREVKELKKKVRKLEAQVKARKSTPKASSGGSSGGSAVPPPAP